MIALLAPGQGSQTPGMLTPWLDLPGAPDHVRRWSAATGLDLLALGTGGSADEVRDTAVAQPLLTAVALLSAEALLDGQRPDVVCGHSVGELAVAAAAGVIDGDDAVRLAALRGAAMARAAAEAPTGMAALLGGDEAEVAAAVAGLGLEVATVNVAGQVVVGGPTAALAALAEARPGGARVRRLEVAGAFHTRAMRSAVPALTTAIAALAPADPVCPVVANADGARVTRGQQVLDRLVAQLTGPVRFDRCLAALTGVRGVVELAPGGTLAALARRALPDAEVVALRTPDDLPAARALLPVAAA